MNCWDCLFEADKVRVVWFISPRYDAGKSGNFKVLVLSTKASSSSVKLLDQLKWPY